MYPGTFGLVSWSKYDITGRFNLANESIWESGFLSLDNEVKGRKLASSAFPFLIDWGGHVQF